MLRYLHKCEQTDWQKNKLRGERSQALALHTLQGKGHHSLDSSAELSTYIVVVACGWSRTALPLGWKRTVFAPAFAENNAGDQILPQDKPSAC